MWTSCRCPSLVGILASGLFKVIFVKMFYFFVIKMYRKRERRRRRDILCASVYKLKGAGIPAKIHLLQDVRAETRRSRWVIYPFLHPNRTRPPRSAGDPCGGRSPTPPRAPRSHSPVAGGGGAWPPFRGRARGRHTQWGAGLPGALRKVAAPGRCGWTVPPRGAQGTASL